MTRVAAVICVAALAVVGAACEPQSPDTGAWRDDAYYATNDVAGDVATAWLVLQQLTRDKVPQAYAQVALVYAEDDVGKKESKLGSYQPPDADLARYHHVTSALSDAGNALSDARIAVVRHDTASYAGLMHRLDQQQKSLDRLESALGGVGGP